MSWFDEIFDLVKAIPATFWGVIFGSVVSLGGVILSNRANDRRLRLQLLHDRDLKSRERELSLKKEVYLAAAEAIAVGINALGKFANLEIQNDTITSEYSEKFPAISKMQVIAKEDTTEAILNVTGELTAAYLRLYAKRIPLIQQNNRIMILKEQIKGFESVRDRMLELMRQYNISGEVNQQKFSVIEQNFNFEQTRIADAIQEQETLSVDVYSKQLVFVKDCIDEITIMNRIVVPAIVAIRAELELPIDQASYTDVIEKNIKRQEMALATFIEQVRPNFEVKK